MTANREKVMMSCARPQNIQLRKQKSINCDSICQLTSATRERRFRLQKQYSVDQNANNRNVSTICNQRSIDIQSKCENGSWNGSDQAPETSLRIFTAFKNNKANIDGIEPNNSTHKLPENVKTSTNRSAKRNEEKININIFLAQAIPELDLTSDSECGVKQAMPTSKMKSVANPAKTSAETRRIQFRRKSASLNDARPRLTRVMSAPIRQNPPAEAQDRYQNGQHNNSFKKRLRRKKIAPVEMDTFNLKLAHHQHIQNKIMVDKIYEERPSTAKALTSRLSKTTKSSKIIAAPRARSAVNVSEIVTLVSLLSPSASDSEREDHSSNGTFDKSHEKHAPSLRKVGKSVSFQDGDNFAEEDPIIDLPAVLRRASLVPLTAKIRLNRPPTAPPGSMFHKSNGVGVSSMSPKSMVPLIKSGGKRNDNNNRMPHFGMDSGNGDLTKVSIEIVNCASNRKSSISLLDSNAVFPEYVRSIREKECWLLYQKMSNKGISVSYETILRGMLTPSEVRVVEKKQREIIERQASIELKANDTKNECDNKK